MQNSIPCERFENLKASISESNQSSSFLSIVIDILGFRLAFLAGINTFLISLYSLIILSMINAYKIDLKSYL